MELSFVIEKFVLVTLVFVITLVIAMYSTLAERKIAGFMQDRYGPDRAGIFGLLQPLCDGGKFFFKEEIIPAGAHKALFILGPTIAIITACISSAVIPWGQSLTIGDRVISLQVADVNVGILYMFGVIALGVYGIMLGGWASNNKFSLMGAVRAASQSISYEIAMGLSIIALLMVTQSLSLRDIVAQQSGFLNWNIWAQPLGFIIFMVCAFAECNRVPFDLPECETELVGGYHTEYSSMKLGLYMFSEYINMFVSSALMASLYFGGYNFPFMHDLGLSENWITIIGVLAFFVKIFAFIFFFMWVRWTLPRFRYDQLMNLGWKMLIPLAIANIVLTGIITLIKDTYFS
ncbi:MULTISPECIES: NADH-quinone oxidoreductase subunit NuoH [Sphingobacterium]|jgi:NADH-quinone oxidoreductase subunit H|uniref:NADH-quinone oxidoreductase subunit H n=2 Tax=Sphingobacterium TaxID=28453 RepID=A0ABW5Z127_9SPHI|nr:MULTISPECIES: NADH-quinone oxidoreductase subunit NuoH [Sphingobacterium]KKX50331.1 NADH:ubiquinone oxidoreductase subunit H [Sphingobacterium sp. IITKGP-BTPF85]MBB2954219.1 NADH-quinone oxidoreductase subunit H [Sphingobacterium sp. JUb56]MCW2261941.1 NADH-quinone oxidoreductase subunit H [Sphingobacterium kitahiroshimense]NJI75099.1 NADH-quinone oxidoreductase subunit NuoH [Sphingobacterium sp. B16(2022)]QQD15293.1 NADH-quinone oxidoreductase subunit NuoH [Sphingobacterium sp. UDSM-2020]